MPQGPRFISLHLVQSLWAISVDLNLWHTIIGSWVIHEGKEIGICYYRADGSSTRVRNYENSSPTCIDSIIERSNYRYNKVIGLSGDSEWLNSYVCLLQLSTSSNCQRLVWEFRWTIEIVLKWDESFFMILYQNQLFYFHWGCLDKNINFWTKGHFLPQMHDLGYSFMGIFFPRRF